MQYATSHFAPLELRPYGAVEVRLLLLCPAPRRGH